MNILTPEEISHRIEGIIGWYPEINCGFFCLSEDIAFNIGLLLNCPNITRNGKFLCYKYNDDQDRIRYIDRFCYKIQKLEISLECDTHSIFLKNNFGMPREYFHDSDIDYLKSHVLAPVVEDFLNLCYGESWKERITLKLTIKTREKVRLSGKKKLE